MLKRSTRNVTLPVRAEVVPKRHKRAKKAVVLCVRTASVLEADETEAPIVLEAMNPQCTGRTTWRYAEGAYWMKDAGASAVLGEGRIGDAYDVPEGFAPGRRSQWSERRRETFGTFVENDSDARETWLEDDPDEHARKLDDMILLAPDGAYRKVPEPAIALYGGMTVELDLSRGDRVVPAVPADALEKHGEFIACCDGDIPPEFDVRPAAGHVFSPPALTVLPYVRGVLLKAIEGFSAPRREDGDVDDPAMRVARRGLVRAFEAIDTVFVAKDAAKATDAIRLACEAVVAAKDLLPSDGRLHRTDVEQLRSLVEATASEASAADERAMGMGI